MNMNRHCGIIKFILLGVVCISLLPVSVHAQKYTEFIPGEVWKDTDGNPINAHGGGLLYHNGTYYWYGEYKKGKTILPDWATWECYRTDVTGVGCYSSKDLLNWKFEGIVLPAVKDDPNHDLHPSKVLERPKVVYNKKTGKFVMWAHVESADYSKACAGVAVSDSPVGPFVYQGSFRPNNAMSRDQTVFVDDDGTPWMSWGNGTCFLVKLKPNMTELDGNIEILKMPKFVEGPWIHKRGNLYYLTYASMGKGRETISYATAPSMDGPWTYRGVLTGMAENSFTIHPGIIEFKGQNYLFYHNAILTIDSKSGATGRRSVCIDYLYYLPDGRMAYVEQTKEGITVKPKTAAEVAEIVNPYTDEEEVVVEIVQNDTESRKN